MRINRLFANVAGKALALATVMMTMCVVFTACSKDNEDPKPGSDTGKYVDLGLPSGLKWATCNLGATKPEEYGDYYAWGETTIKNKYEWNTYKWCKGSEKSMTKYCTDSKYGYNGFADGKTALEAEDDVATAKLGAPWRMPTGDEIKELLDKCTWEWTQLNGVKGYKGTGPNGKFIFLPAAGFRSGADLVLAGSWGYFWSSSLYSDDSARTRILGFNPNIHDWGSLRFFGFSVRPVRR